MMDSTTPDPQQRQQQQQQPPQTMQQQQPQQPTQPTPQQQPHQPQQQHHHQQQQQQPTQQHQPRPHQPNQQQQQLRHHQHPAHQQSHPTNYQTMPPPFASYGPPPAAAPYNPRNFGPQPASYAYHPNATTVYAFGYPQPNSWQTPPFVGGPHPQPIPANMVPTQPPASLPQQHNKQPAQIISTNLSNDRPHNQSLPPVSSVPNQTTVRQLEPRKRMVAIMKDPKTKEVVPLVEDTVATKPQQQKQPQSQSQQQQSQPQQVPQPTLTNTNANTNSKAINITNTTSTTANSNTLKQEPVHTLLQKVSEDGLVNVAPAQAAAATSVVAQNKNTGPKDTDSSASAKIKENAVATKAEAKIPEDEKDGHDEKLLVVEPKKASAPSNDEGDSKKPADDSSSKKLCDESKQEEAKDVTNKNAGDLQEVEAVDAENDDAGDSNKEDQESDSQAKLEYEPGQFNPLSNRDGKRIYSRQFLLDVCEKICKIDLTGGRQDDVASEVKFQVTHVDMFAPTFSRGGQMNRPLETNRRQSHHQYAGRSSAGQEKQRKIINCTSLTQEVELKTTANPWRPAKEAKETAPTDEEDTEALKKKFRSILNKLTPNNFENLSKAVSELSIDSESKLGEVIDIVFAKALAEPGYCSLYGQMCSHLKKVSAGSANFANTLLKRCQIQFQSDIYSGVNVKERREKIDNEQDPVIKKQLEDELYDDMFRCRLRGLGLIKFIGELYKIEMLNDTIMFDCVLRLLNDPSEESLECLCDLLQTIGEKLDTSTKNHQAKEEKKAPKNTPKPTAYQGGKSAAAIVASGPSNQQQKALEQQSGPATLDQVFERLHKIRKNKDSNLSVRIRFKILDVCELRERDNWKSKKSKDNPKTIDEIKADHIEKQEQERRANIGGRRSQEGRRLGPSGGSSSHISSLANESGGHRGNSHMHTSSSSNVIHRDMSGNDNMKTNHDLEERKHHLTFLKTIMKSKENSSSNEALMPNAQFRPPTRLGPQTRVIQPRDSSNAENK